MIVSVLVCSVVLAVCFAERISNTPDVTWNRSPSSLSDTQSGVSRESNIRPSSINRDNSFSSSGSSDSDRFPITGGSGASRSGSRTSQTGTGSGFGFDEESNSNTNSRFPISGGSGSPRGSSGSIGSSGSSGSRFGSSSGSGSRGSDSLGTTPDPTKNYYVRIVASLVRLNNSKSATSTGGSCTTFGKCDPIIFAELDTERPNANWPGARDTKLWTQIFAGKDLDSFTVGIDNITKDVCGQNYREADLRVRVEDKKMLTSNAVINEFDCPINRTPQEVSSALAAIWSPVMPCLPRFPKGMQSLSFRYKVFYVSKFSCGTGSASTSTTKGSFFG